MVDDTPLALLGLLVCLAAAVSLLLDIPQNDPPHDGNVSGALVGGANEQGGTGFTCPEEILPILQVFRRCRLMYDDNGNELPPPEKSEVELESQAC